MNSKKLSVLIVDDDEIDRYVLRRNLRKNTSITHIHEAYDGQSAIEFFEDYLNADNVNRTNCPASVVFLDINMPRKNGFDFLDGISALANRSEHPFLPTVVMYTSSDLAKERAKAHSYHFVKHYLLKEECNEKTVSLIIDTVQLNL